jgi:hypothetical protein
LIITKIKNHENKNFFFGLPALCFFILYCSSCTQKKAETEVKIENTLKSVSLLSDSIGIEPHEMFLSLERVNRAIDSIGYPDAGYKLWVVKVTLTRLSDLWLKDTGLIRIFMSSYTLKIKGLERF